MIRTEADHPEQEMEVQFLGGGQDKSEGAVYKKRRMEQDLKRELPL
ncbi:hypothetical protein [Candidatus Formimonas warabiya]|nr:hypothetical protein [Candidatus Formimonas warabiya]